MWKASETEFWYQICGTSKYKIKKVMCKEDNKDGQEQEDLGRW